MIRRQTTENFIRCLENAFWHFGGVPQTLFIDNLRAAVCQADWYDPDLNPKLQAFCEVDVHSLTKLAQIADIKINLLSRSCPHFDGIALDLG